MDVLPVTARSTTPHPLPPIDLRREHLSVYRFNYPPGALEFDPKSYYWPDPTGLYFREFKAWFPEYPECMKQGTNEPNWEYRVRMRYLREHVDELAMEMEFALRKRLKSLGYKHLEVEYLIGECLVLIDYFHVLSSL